MADEAASHGEVQPSIAVDVAPDAAAAAATPTAAAAAAAADTLAPGTGTATPALSDAGVPLDPEQQSLSLKVSLADLSAKATALYAHKSYEEAAEVFAQAAEMQAEMNGEMSPDNAEILFLYGRSLFKVGQSKSDVLGGRAPEAQAAAAGGKQQKKKKAGGEGKKKKEEAATAPAGEEEAQKTEVDKVAEEAVKIIADQAEGAKKVEETVDAKKPLFQFTGDENFDDSDEEEAEEEEGDAEEEDDDLAVAFEILDLSRVLFNKKLDELNEAAAAAEGKGKEKAEDEGDIPAVRHIKERLADTHDLLAEISLENERYPNAIVDSRQSLKFKKELYPPESEIVAEAHYKLSLALEFASITSSGDDEENDSSKAAGPKPVDEGLREEAATELEAAIESTKLKLQKKEVDLVVMHSPEDNELTRKQIAEVKDVIADMEQRLVDLRKPPIDVNAALYGPAGIASGGNPLSGILGAALGESPAQAEARIEEAKKTAHDLTGLVRKKHKEEPKPAAAEQPHAEVAAEEANGHKEEVANGKRKAEEPAEAEAETKKARVGETAEAS